MITPHSHDSADAVDSALESSRKGIRALVISFAVLMLTAIIQLGLVLITNSTSLLADTIHNFSDALTAVPLFLAFRIGRRVPSPRYTFGYRRAEDLAGLFIILMIATSAVVVFVESLDRLANPEPLNNLGVLLAAGIVGFLGNEAVAIFRIRVGREIGSAALIADGHHARADGFTSLGVVAGAIGALLGFPIVDAVMGLVISLAIFVVLVGAARQVYYRMMDAVDPSITKKVEQTAGAADGVLGVSDVRVRWMGHKLDAVCSIDVDADLSVTRSHEVAESVRHRLLHEVEHLESVTVHVDPHVHASAADPHEMVAHHADPLASKGHRDHA